MTDKIKILIVEDEARPVQKSVFSLTSYGEQTEATSVTIERTQPIKLFGWHQSLPRATESQLNSEGGGDQNVNFPGLNFLQIARCNFGSFRQFILRQFFANALTTDVCAKGLDSLPFFFGNGHDILHRFLRQNMNDTYIVKNI
jgi:hypothetical protein